MHAVPVAAAWTTALPEEFEDPLAAAILELTVVDDATTPLTPPSLKLAPCGNECVVAAKRATLVKKWYSERTILEVYTQEMPKTQKRNKYFFKRYGPKVKGYPNEEVTVLHIL